jgi:uncharacterized protein YbbC (DUF1343 family)
MPAIQLGLQNLLTEPPAWLKNQRLGLLCNAASLDSDLIHARVGIDRRFPNQLKCLFAPQHGFFGEKQDNMIESADCIDALLNIPVFSLYGQTRIPTAQMFDGIDILLVDLPDVGTRVYTFIYTLSYCLERAAELGIKVVVLDRPNPLGGRIVEGNLLADACRSFVGRFALPMRHGLTIGEIALLFNQHFGIGAELEIIPMHGWRRDDYFDETGLVWIPPSPNLPTLLSALVYPGQVLWEGTNISEGRGTTLPFEICGAPFIDPYALLQRLGGPQQAGLWLRPVTFEPTANKWQATACHGLHLHVTDRQRFRPYETTLRLLQAISLLYPEHFDWKQPPYEYEYERLPIDLILGDPNLRRDLLDNRDITELTRAWQDEIEAFKKVCRPYFLYA